MKIQDKKDIESQEFHILRRTMSSVTLLLGEREMKVFAEVWMNE